ncbi:MAG: RIP metalloprotease RseP [Alphaproteobacteria bacterium]|nr:RIP metalloprotease RseP [Alphaproteobacteria bacterium]
MTTLIYLFSFVLILSLVVIVHEGGHFFVARLCGIQVEAFSIGFGKKLWVHKDKKGTEWRLCAIPLGGYVQMLGDEDAASTKKSKKVLTDEEKERTFFAQPVYKRAAVIFAGPFMNYVLAVVIFAAILATVGYPRIPARVGQVMEGSVAQKVGIQVGDLILSVNNKKIEDFSDLKRAIVLGNYGQSIDLQIQRNEEILSLSATPELVGKDEVPQLGVISEAIVEPSYKKYNLIGAIGKAIQEVYQMNVDTFVYLKQIVTGKRKANDLRGPVGIAEASGDAARGGWLSFILFLAQVSVGIGFVNLLPVPILDGGHLVFLLYEAIVRKPVSERVQNALLKVGMALLLFLFCFTLFKDIPRVIGRVFGL